MSEYTFQISDYSKSAAQALYNFRSSVSDTVYGGMSKLRSTADYLMSSISDANARATRQMTHLKSKAITMVNTIRTTAHRSVDGALIGLGTAFLFGGLLAVPSGIYAGSILGAIYGFCEATDNPYDNAALQHQRELEDLTFSKHY